MELAVTAQTITNGLKYSVATGNWGQQNVAGAKAGVSQVSPGASGVWNCCKAVVLRYTAGESRTWLAPRLAWPGTLLGQRRASWWLGDKERRRDLPLEVQELVGGWALPHDVLVLACALGAPLVTSRCALGVPSVISWCSFDALPWLPLGVPFGATSELPPCSLGAAVVHAGAEPAHFCVHSVPPAASQLTHWPGR